MELNKKLLQDTSNAIIYFIPEYSMVIVDLKDISFIDEQNYKNSALALLEFVRERKIKRLLFNTLKLKDVFSIELQEWIAQNVNKELLTLLDKVAIVEPENPITHISLMQYVEETNKYGTKAKERFFQNEDEAIKWLIND
jgi:hypothetical protein